MPVASSQNSCASPSPVPGPSTALGPYGGGATGGQQRVGRDGNTACVQSAPAAMAGTTPTATVWASACQLPNEREGPAQRQGTPEAQAQGVSGAHLVHSGHVVQYHQVTVGQHRHAVALRMTDAGELFAQ